MKRWIGEEFNKYRERLKGSAEQLKEYLRGKIRKGTEVMYSGPKHGRKLSSSSKYSLIDTCENFNRSKLKEHRKHRKIKNKIARQSRRINRLRAA